MVCSNCSMVAVVSAIWDWREEMVSSQSAWLVALALSASDYCPSNISMIWSMRTMTSSSGTLEAKFN